MTGGTPPFMKQSHISKFLAVEDEEEKEEKPSEVLQGVNSVIASEYCPQYLTIIIFWIQQKRIHPVHSSTASGFGLVLFGHILAKWPQSRYAEAQPVGNQSGSGQCMAVHQTKSLLTDGYVSYDDQ